MGYSPEERSICRIVGTPIGNLGDMTPRAVEAMREADVVFAEDTRTAAALLNHFQISNKIESYHKDNELKAAEQVLKHLEKGEKVVLISEAGMPGVSDPGFQLIKELLEKQIPFEVVPGVSAGVHAAVASGLCKDGRYLFVGFLPRKGFDKVLEELADIPFPIVFYESPHRVKETIATLLKNFPPPVAVCRELTKLHEEVLHINSEEELDKITVKGEFCLVVDNSDCKKDLVEESITVEPQILAETLIKNGVSAKNIAEVLKNLGIKRNIAYEIAQNADKE